MDSEHFTFDLPLDFFLSAAPLFLFTLLAPLFVTKAALFGDPCKARPFFVLTLHTQALLFFELYARLLLTDAAGFSLLAKALLCLEFDARLVFGYESSILLLLALVFCLCLSLCFFFGHSYATLLLSDKAL